ncbi:hypothetical protein [Streptomyces sp. NPDC058632]|uniref:hypothetical protein n=1 Tax=Streptomyces sp. NPDC058632 TaxID=3346567 RepID=UPI00364F58F5
MPRLLPRLPACPLVLPAGPLPAGCPPTGADDAAPGPTARPPSRSPIVVDGRPPCATTRPDGWETGREVFAEAVRRTPSLTVALTLGGSSEPRAGLSG